MTLRFKGDGRDLVYPVTELKFYGEDGVLKLIEDIRRNFGEKMFHAAEFYYIFKRVTDDRIFEETFLPVILGLDHPQISK